MFGASLMDVQGCFALCVEHQVRTEQSPSASLVCALGRAVSPRCGPSLNSMAESPSSVCWLLAQGLDLVVLDSDLSIRADLLSSLAWVQKTNF